MVISCFIFATVFSWINADSKTAQQEEKIVKTAENKPEMTKPTVEPKKQEEQTNWIYVENEDKMTSKKIYNAYIEAKEDLSFSFPYNWGSTPSIVLRNKDGVNDMMLKVTKWQFMTGVYGGNVRIRFDAEQPIKVNFTNTSDGSNDTIFIESTNNMISRMKKSKKIIVEAEFYNEGNRLMEFEVAWLRWEH